MDWREYIYCDPDLLAGKPAVKDTRLAVDFILGLLAAGWTYQQLFENYPSLNPRVLQAIFAYTSECLLVQESVKLRDSQYQSKVSDNVLDYALVARPAQQHQVILIGGPNGAGKSTTAPDILQGAFRVDEFVNADTIAHGLSAFRPEKAAIKAGRVMLARLHELAVQKMNFAFETTLSSRSFAPWIKELKKLGYRSSIMFFWLESPQLAVGRVAERVLNGGHNVPEDVILRRYEAGLSNFFRVYQPVADHWRFYDNSNAFAPVLLATGEENSQETILAPEIWKSLKEKYL